MAGLGRRTHYRKHLTDSVLHDLPEPKDDERIAKVVSTRGGNQFDIVLAVPAPPSTTTTELRVSGNNNNNGSYSGGRTPQLAILPTKFHKLVWVKRNDYVIVQTGTMEGEDDNDSDEDHSDDKIDHVNNSSNSSNDEENNNDDDNDDEPTTRTTKELDHHQGGIRYIITHILYKDQVKHLRVKGLWPVGDPEFDGTDVGQQQQQQVSADHEGREEEVDDDGIVYNEYDDENDDDLFVNTNRIARLEIQDSDDEASSDEDQ